ncbi:unnamed protein product [Rhizophagus irregularis]|uniref:Uncharacterized protein n=1 Tax=Rhizophagus irregularis TaxID=588596 RepID=A0A916EHC1_9GLOM|nr:unnamed protein product [Rhizophagus irregularis]
MEIKGPSACFFGIRNGLSVFDFGKQGTERVPDVRMMVPDVWMKRSGTPKRIHELDFGWKITLTSTSAKLELKWLRSSKRKCLAKVKGMKGKGEGEKCKGKEKTKEKTKGKGENERERENEREYFEGSAAIGQTGIQYFEGSAAYWTYGIQHFEGSAAYWTYGIQHFKGSAAYWTYGIQYFEGSAAYWTYGIQHFEGFLFWHWCGLSIDYRISDKYRLSLNNNNCAFINK